MQISMTGCRLRAALLALAAVVAAPLARGQQAGSAATALGPPLAAVQLAATRGMGGVAAEATLGGAVSANSAANVSTGANMIQGGAFAGASGVPVVIQNTGANVMIQNATVIHLQLQ